MEAKAPASPALPWSPTPRRFVPPGCGAPAGPLRGQRAGDAASPLLPPSAGRAQREGDAEGERQAAGSRPGGQAGTDHWPGAPSRPVPPAARAARGGGARLLPPRPAGPGAAGGGGGPAHHGPHHRGGRALPRLLSAAALT